MIGYGLLFAVVLIALWASDRRKPRRRPPRYPGRKLR
jgi:hypothetical protein